jgi:S1-C subfamily serine protease
MAARNPFDDYYSRRTQPATPWWVFALLLGAIALLVFWLWPRHQTGLNPRAESLPVARRDQPLLSEEQTNIKIYNDTAPSVVHVSNLAEARRPFSLNVERIRRGTGSGFVWDDQGHIVTNYHVVKDADAIQVVLADQSKYDAQDVWGYPEKDIAVIWIKAPKAKLHPIRLGSSHDLKVGQKTYVIGNPFGLDQTLTTGIVSALGREVGGDDNQTLRGLIQTSAPINPGNSGGPMFDSDGRVIGMTTAIISPSGAFAGVGLAIPSDEINQVVPQLIRHGKVVRPRLGVQLAEDQQALRLGVDEGVLILRVAPGTPADKAGLLGTHRDESGRFRLGDVIVAIDDKKIRRGSDYFAVLGDFKVGQTVTVTILREGERLRVKVTLEAAE